MKIGIFTNNYLPNPYGVSGSVESFRKVFEKLGHDAYIFAPEWKGYKDENPRVFRYPSLKTNIKIKFPIAIPYSRKASDVIENLDLDIIHSQHPNLLGSAAMRWAKKKNIPLIFTWHTLYDQYAHFVPFVPRQLAAWLAIRNARIYANRCDTVITPTESIMGIIRKWGVTNKNITAIPTGVEEKQLENPDGKGVREKYGVQDDEILLFVLTRFTPEKNMEFLFDCAMEVLKKNKKVKFMASGEGYLEEKLKEKVANEKLENRVIFVGHTESDVKKNYYAAGDIFIYASKSETQGMVLTEAMYCGLPIVAVQATGACDIIQDGRTGFLVPENLKEFGGAIQKLIDNADLRKKFSEEAKGVARGEYTSSACAQKMLEVYEKAITNHK